MAAVVHWLSLGRDVPAHLPGFATVGARAEGKSLEFSVHLLPSSPLPLLPSSLPRALWQAERRAWLSKKTLGRHGCQRGDSDLFNRVLIFFFFFFLKHQHTRCQEDDAVPAPPAEIHRAGAQVGQGGSSLPSLKGGLGMGGDGE